MNARIRRFCLTLLGSLALGLGALTATQAAGDASEPVLLVAKPELGEFYRSTVLLAVPARNGHHIGLIINRPTPMTLSRLFPDHAPSKAVTDPVFLGGPNHVNSIFAVVHRGDSPGGHSIPLLDDLFLAVDVDIVDSIIEKQPQDARFFAGLVVWDAGELEAELKRGFWYVLQPDSDLVLRRSTQGMWEELSRRSANAL
jgi:putative transcriptional regulator